ncbi:PREDICTED: uncharacterized protein LOC109208865 [Nicotiana attenuata]|uniref:Uncharacterized protein n=1 Tax=Nicotiana attenuata TaxID=49451 RepID=A0A314KRC0_NICAT|nr:PREDICTED: uncharacterized protein LOC109208865 [Nicotiana attenuata]OIT31304.1 hypothetical protein A4A49_30046 [Nicotiana attenuata]
MGDCPPNYKSVSENVGGFCESSKETPDCAFGYIEGLSINDLGCHFTDYLNIQGGEDSNNKCNSEAVKEDVTKDFYGSDSGKVASVKCLIKCATFPCSGLSVPPAEIGGEERTENVTAEVMTHGADAKSPDLSYSRSVSLPTPLKLVSAIKGGREKQGSLPRKLTVTWAPDVYDPVPTAVSHVPNKGQCHKSGKKKNGKNKQKNNGKSSRGSKGKDKKQARKHGGSSQISYHPLDDSNITDSSGEVQSSVVDFDIGRPDPFCASSFLRKSITKLHFPVAEAS